MLISILREEEKDFEIDCLEEVIDKFNSLSETEKEWFKLICIKEKQKVIESHIDNEQGNNTVKYL